MVDGVEVALEVAFNHVEVFGVGVEQGHQVPDGVHRATTFSEAVRVLVEI